METVLKILKQISVRDTGQLLAAACIHFVLLKHEDDMGHLSVCGTYSVISRKNRSVLVGQILSAISYLKRHSRTVTLYS